jgi:hypothetical protein
VFYFGNLVGETGAAVGASLSLNALDTLRTRAALSHRRPVPVTSVFDFNRDGRVDVRDLALARARRPTVLQLITV